MVVFRKVALMPVIAIASLALIFFSMDLYTNLIHREEARVQTYVAGFYVAGMSADPAALASGRTSSNDLYKNDAILREFVNYAYSSFEPVTTVDPENKDRVQDRISAGSTNIKLNFPVGEGFLDSVDAECEVVSSGGVKGVRVTIGYLVDPKLNIMLPDTVQMKPYPIYISRNFRILGQ